MKRNILGLVALLMALVLVLGSCGADTTAKKKQENAAATVTEAPATAVPEVTEAPEEAGPIIEPQAIADYIFEHGELPGNFITKKEAQALGWDSSWNYVSDVAPGMSIGGDKFGNYEGKLPKVKGRKYYECDCWYTGGKRNAYRIIYSDDGHVWYTEDHYNTFTEMKPTEK
jgi:guanyl-specific ribonuclease Sa